MSDQATLLRSIPEELPFITPPGASSDVLFDVSTKLMQNYRNVVPAMGGGALSVIATNAGPLIAGISTTSHGYVLVEDPASESGWRSVSLGPAVLTQSAAAVVDSVGTPHVFATDGSSLLQASQTGADPVVWSQFAPVPSISAPAAWSYSATVAGLT
ncbi:MAG TPA: hypothetical protein VIW26_09875 [Gemmatimonadales bacterium]|jgi:hypothetical protein